MRQLWTSWKAKVSSRWTKLHRTAPGNWDRTLCGKQVVGATLRHDKVYPAYQDKQCVRCQKLEAQNV